MLLLLRGLLDAQSALDGNVAEVAPADDSASAVVVRAGEVVEVGAAADTGGGFSATSAVGVEGAAATESSGRSSQTSAIATELSGDPFFSNVSLLLHADGTSGSAVFTDSSPNPKTTTAVGDPKLSNVQVKFGSGSMFFDGFGDVVRVAASSDFSFGTGDFTIELWANRLAAGSGDRFLIDRGNGSSFLLRWNAAGAMQFFINSTLVLSKTLAFTIGAWFHIAVVRSGASCALYLDGVSEATGTSSANITSAAIARLGGYEVTSSDYFHGYMDEVRITKGVARYTSAFTPASSAFLDSSTTDIALAISAAVSSAAITETSALVDAVAASTVATGALAELVAAIEVTAGASAVSRGSTEVTAAADAPSATRSTAALQSEVGALSDVQSAVRSALAEAAEVGIAIDEPAGATLVVSDLVEAASAGEDVAATRLVPLAAIAEMVSAAEFLQGIVFGAAGVSEGASALDGFEAIRYSTGAVNESPGSGYGNVGEVVDAIWRHRNALTVARYLTDGDGPLLTPVDIPPELADLVDAVWADTRALSQSKYQILKE